MDSHSFNNREGNYRYLCFFLIVLLSLVLHLHQAVAQNDLGPSQRGAIAAVTSYLLSDEAASEDSGFGCPPSVNGDCIQLAEFGIVTASTVPGASNLISNPSTITASRTTCAAPCGVHFTANPSPDFDVSYPDFEVAYHWDFDDEGAVFQSLSPNFIFGNSAETAQGKYTAHVFEKPGTYDVTLRTAAKNGEYSNTTVAITVTDVVTALSLSDADIICVSSTSNYTDCPTATNRYTDLDAAKAYMATRNNAAMYLRAGDTFELATTTTFRSGNYWLGKYGNGSNPLVNATTKSGQFDNWDANSFYASYIDFRGNWSYRTGIGETHSLAVLYNGRGGSGYFAHNVTVYRTSYRGLGYCFRPTGGDYHVYADNDCSEWRNFGSLDVRAFAVSYVGNYMKQPEDIISGPDALSFSENTYTGDNATTTFSYTFGVLPIAGNGSSYLGLAYTSDIAPSQIDSSVVSNLAVKTESGGVITYLTQGVDYSHNTVAETVTFNTPPASGVTVTLYHRAWADHGPIRSSDSKQLVVQMNDMYAKNGWFANGRTHQPAFRYNSNGTAGHSGSVNKNIMEGGTMAALFESANPGIAMYPGGNLVFERNRLNGSSSTYNMVRNAYGGVLFRNNILYQPNVQTHTNAHSRGFYNWENWESGNGTDNTNFDAPVHIYNNTVENLSNWQLSRSGGVSYIPYLPHENDGSQANGSPIFSDYLYANGLVYSPLAPQDTTDPGFDSEYYPAIEANHTADDSTIPGLFDDFWGMPRSAITTNGATQESADVFD